MQLFADQGYEAEVSKGLGWIGGEVKKFSLDKQKFRLPHVGWNDVKEVNQSKLLKNCNEDLAFYFVHGYHFVPEDKSVIKGKCNYGGDFVAIIENENIFGTQFHPEKSHTIGKLILKNFLEL